MTIYTTVAVDRYGKVYDLVAFVLGAAAGSVMYRYVNGP
jgi:hypothetical protein